MSKKFFAIATFAFAFAIAASAGAVYQSDIFTAESGYLKVGSGMGAKMSQMSHVIAAQTALNACVPGSNLKLDGKFGPLTKGVFMSFQASKGIKVDGVIGPVTAAQLAACSTGTTPTPTPVVTGLNGTAGLIADVNKLSQYNNEEIGAGQSDVKVLGVDVKASKDGDIDIKNMKVSFAITNASGSTKVADYVKTVSIWKGSTMVASAVASDFNKDSTGNYSKTISFTSSAIVRADTTEKFYVTIDALTVLDSGDIDSEVATVGIDSIRFADGSGVVTTEATAGDLPISSVAVSFVTFSSAANTELKISTENTPKASVVKASTTADTDNVVLLAGKIKLDGTSSVWLDEMPFTLVTVGGTSLDDVASTVTLKIGNNSYSESLGANCTPTCVSNTTGVVKFDNLDFTVSAGSTVNFTVTANINDINGGAFAEGDSLSASLLTTNRDDIVAENSKGDQLTDSTEMTGSAIGENQSFRSKGINTKLVGTPTAVISHTGDIVGSGAGDDDQGTFEIIFDVTAFGSDIYIDGTAPTLTGAGALLDLNLVETGTHALTGATITSPSGATLTGTANADARFKVTEGSTERFKVSAVVTVSVDGFASIAISDIVYALTDVTGTTSHTVNLVDFKTGDLYMNAN